MADDYPDILEQDIEELPFIFKNKELTIPANDHIKQWLMAMLEYHPQDLKFLHLKSQEYVKHGGANAYTFTRWLGKLEKDCNKTKEF